MPTDSLAIDLARVGKTYKGKVRALDDVALRVHPGEVFGLLGPNGAGKSTLVKILMTVIRPTVATGTLLGRPVGHKPTLARVGYLPESHRFPRYLTGRQVVDFFGALAKVPRRARRRRAEELLETVGMTEWADRRIGTYSKGMAQRVGLAQALVMDPDLVVLDEPTDGVDPAARRQIRDVLAALRDRGKTVFVNSHLLSDLELICDRVAILVGGRIAAQGTIDELALSKQRYEIDLAPPPPEPGATGPPPLTMPDAAALGDAIHATFEEKLAPPTHWATVGPEDRSGMTYDRGRLWPSGVPDGLWVEWQPPTLRLGTTDPALVQPVLDRLRHANYTVRRLQPVRPSLEDLFLDAVDASGAGGRAGARLS